MGVILFPCHTAVFHGKLYFCNSIPNNQHRMGNNLSIDSHEFLRLYRRLYLFLRQSWKQEMVLRLREMVRNSLRPTDPGVLYELILEMRTAVITLDEIGL